MSLVENISYTIVQSRPILAASTLQGVHGGCCLVVGSTSTHSDSQQNPQDEYSVVLGQMILKGSFK